MTKSNALSANAGKGIGLLGRVRQAGIFAGLRASRKIHLTGKRIFRELCRCGIFYCGRYAINSSAVSFMPRRNQTSIQPYKKNATYAEE